MARLPSRRQHLGDRSHNPSHGAFQSLAPSAPPRCSRNPHAICSSPIRIDLRSPSHCSRSFGECQRATSPAIDYRTSKPLQASRGRRVYIILVVVPRSPCKSPPVILDLLLSNSPCHPMYIVTSFPLITCHSIHVYKGSFPTSPCQIHLSLAPLTSRLRSRTYHRNLSKSRLRPPSYSTTPLRDVS